MDYDIKNDIVLDTAMEGFLKPSNKNYKFKKETKNDGFMYISSTNGKNGKVFFVPNENKIYSTLISKGTVSSAFKANTERFFGIIKMLDDTVKDFSTKIPSSDEIEKHMTYQKGITMNRKATISDDLVNVLKSFIINLSKIEKDYKALLTGAQSIEKQDVEDIKNLKEICKKLSDVMINLTEEVIKHHETYYNDYMNTPKLNSLITQNQFGTTIPIRYYEKVLFILPKIYTTLIFEEDHTREIIHYINS